MGGDNRARTKEKARKRAAAKERKKKKEKEKTGSREITAERLNDTIGKLVTRYMSTPRPLPEVLSVVLGMHHMLGMMKSAAHYSREGGLDGKSVQRTCLKAEMDGFELYKKRSGIEESRLILPGNPLFKPTLSLVPSKKD
jgi:hypothetical protein